MGLRLYSYQGQLAELQELGKFLARLGLTRAHDRLCQIIRNLGAVEAARQDERLGELSEARIVWSIVEGTEFSAIYEGLRDYDPSILKPLLRNALKGPLQPLHEQPSGRSTKGRDTMFELRLGAGIRLATMSAMVDLGREADLCLDYLGSRIFIECKRPFYQHTVRSNIERARHQLRTRLNADDHPVSAGLVAISVSKALNPGDSIYYADDEEALRSGLIGEVLRMHKDNG